MFIIYLEKYILQKGTKPSLQWQSQLTLTFRTIDSTARGVLPTEPHVDRPCPRLRTHAVDVGVREETLDLASFLLFPARHEQPILENDEAMILWL